MSEEMVTRTTDSPAVATGGMAGALMDSIREVAPSDASDNGALNSYTDSEQNSSNETYDDLFSGEDIESKVRQKLLDTVGNNQQPGNVPYERFREVNDEAKELRKAQDAYNKWADVIKQFEANGFQSAADLQKARQEQELAQTEQNIRNKWQDQVETAYVDPSIAEARAEAEISSMRYDRVMGEMNNYMLTQQRAAAFESFPYARRAEDVVDKLIQSGISPVDAAQAVHQQVAGLVESLVPELVNMLDQRRSVPTPIDTGYSAQPVVQQPSQSRRPSLSGLSRLLGIGN
jgi:uncharacterized protein YdaT